MKKSVKCKSPSAAEKAGSDIAVLINGMQQQLISLEKKIDILINRPSERPLAAQLPPRPSPAPVQGAGQPQRNVEVKQVNGYRERVLHKAICADCNKGCEVPFKPSGDRPVYCKECFSKRKQNSPFKPARPDIKPREAVVKVTQPYKKPVGESIKTTEKKKKISAKKRKKSA